MKNLLNSTKEQRLTTELIFEESAWLKEISSIKKANRRVQLQKEFKQNPIQTQEQKIELILTSSDKNEENP